MIFAGIPTKVIPLSFFVFRSLDTDKSASPC
jgi:hypothetical protein